MTGSGIQNANAASMMLQLSQGSKNNAAVDRQMGDFAAVFQSMSVSMREDLAQYVGENPEKEENSDVFQVTPAGSTQGNIGSADSNNGRMQESLSNAGASRRDEIRMEEKQPLVEEETNKLENAAEGFVEETKKILTEAFAITEEELVSAMAMLGLNFTDLMDTQNFVQLSMELTHSGFSAILLISGQYQNAFEQFTTLVNDLSAVLGVEPEELPEILAQAMVQKSVPEFDAAFQEQLQAIQDAPVEEHVQDMEQQVMVQPQKQVQEETVFKDVSVDDSQGKPEVQAVQQPDEENSLSENSDNGFEEAKPDADQVMAGSEKQSAVQAQHVNVSTNFETVYDAASGQTVTTMTQTTVDMQSIMDQFTQTVRVFVGTENSSIEMQLAPEHLGKVFLHVSEVEGQIKAQIAVQNEAVREAMASQLASLKETLNQQGIRVEAVEVTIASHEFERNLEEQNQGTDNGREEENSRESANRRNINLNEEEPIQGLMSEEEALVMQMMQDRGNTVDFTA